MLKGYTFGYNRLYCILCMGIVNKDVHRMVYIGYRKTNTFVRRSPLEVSLNFYSSDFEVYHICFSKYY